MRLIEVSKKFNLGFSVLEVLITAVLFGGGVLLTSNLYTSQHSKQKVMENDFNAAGLYFDLLHKLKDPAVCTASFKRPGQDPRLAPYEVLSIKDSSTTFYNVGSNHTYENKGIYIEKIKVGKSGDSYAPPPVSEELIKLYITFKSKYKVKGRDTFHRELFLRAKFDNNPPSQLTQCVALITRKTISSDPGGGGGGTTEYDGWTSNGSDIYVESKVISIGNPRDEDDELNLEAAPEFNGALRSKGDKFFDVDMVNHNFTLGLNPGRDVASSYHRQNTYLGFMAGFKNMHGQDNTFIGQQAGTNIIGYIDPSGNKIQAGDGNTFIGYFSGSTLKGAGANQALNNTFIGARSAQNLEQGSDNVVIGVDAARENNQLESSVIIGNEAGDRSEAQTEENVFIGHEAGKNNNGSNNVFIGHKAGADITGSYNTFIGHDLEKATQWGEDYQLNIGNLIRGYGAAYLGSAEPLARVTIGEGFKDAHIPDEQCGLSIDGTMSINGSAYEVSDRRLKENILDLVDSKEKILKLSARSYFWKKSKKKTKDYGFIAQELELVFPEFILNSNKGFKSVNYMGLVPHLSKAHQDFSSESISVDSKLDSVNDDLNKLEKKLMELKDE